LRNDGITRKLTIELLKKSGHIAENGVNDWVQFDEGIVREKMGNYDED